MSTIPADSYFEHLDGSIIYSRGDFRFTMPLAGLTAGEIWKAFAEFTKPGRAVFQYMPGKSGNEAGSGWVDHKGGEDLADAALGYLAHIEEGFAAGEEFVP